ncbi:hypothetical protein [Aporhodopirellula aestuarii]|nr:hypothetical protein [Aporhodopirellula aestuarii]
MVFATDVDEAVGDLVPSWYPDGIDVADGGVDGVDEGAVTA